MNKYVQPLRILATVVAVVGYFVAKELERRDTEEIVTKVLNEREAKKAE